MDGIHSHHGRLAGYDRGRSFDRPPGGGNRFALGSFVADLAVAFYRDDGVSGLPLSLAFALGGRGRILAGDGQWTVRGPDLPEGEMVKVTDADGTELLVEKA